MELVIGLAVVAFVAYLIARHNLMPTFLLIDRDLFRRNR